MNEVLNTKGNTCHLKEAMLERQAFLEKMERSKKKALERAPKGSLRISYTKGCRQYYHKTKESGRNGIYLPAEQRELATQLAQKDYDKRVLAAAEKERRAIERCLALCPDAAAEEVYGRLTADRQELVKPVRETGRAFAERWQAMTYPRMGFDEGDNTEFYTDKGERVRSKSEMIIANALKHAGIPYHYEMPVYLEGRGEVRPDFTVLNVRLRREIIWEHLGLLDKPGYATDNTHKLAAYQLNGYRWGETFVMTCETGARPLSIRLVNLMIEAYCL